MNKVLSKYIEKHSIHQQLVQHPVPHQLQTIVIIPAFNEPGIIKTLESLKTCTPTKKRTEVLVLFNYSETCPPTLKEQNQDTAKEVDAWCETNSRDNLRFYSQMVKDLPKKHAGAGLARKIIMDEAVRRFQSAENPDGVIVSLDADTWVSKNYLVDIEKWFSTHKKAHAVTFYFEHRLQPDIFGEKATQAIIKYELYLRYFKQLLTFTGFPYAFHTLGSAFAVKAISYAKQGGMNRKQGGEDFYFLHKIFPLGHCTNISKVKVYPSARPSDRVPFGTGPAIKKIINSGQLLTYTQEPFSHLRALFCNKDELFQASDAEVKTFYRHLNASFKDYFPENEFIKKIKEINDNSSSLDSFEKRFFVWMNAFQIIKYINQYFIKNKKIPVTEAAENFAIEHLNLEHSIIGEMELLEFYRKIDSK